MKQFLPALLAAGAILCACGSRNNKSTQATFAPKSATPQMEITKGPGVQPADRAEGLIKMAVLLPDNMDAAILELLEGRAQAIAAANNVSTNSSTIVLVPKLTEISRDITATAPPKHTVNYDFSLYVADLLTGDVYSFEQTSLMGVGDSPELASKNAVTSIGPSDAAYSKIIKKGEEAAFAYYEANGDRLIADALAMAARNEYNEALTVLNSIPEKVSAYPKALEAKNQVLDAFFVANSYELVSKMKQALRSPNNNDEGYSDEFLALYAMVPANSPAKKEADALYAEYSKQYDATIKQKMANKQKEWEQELKDRESIRNNEYQLKQTEIVADAAKNGFNALAEGLKGRKKGLLSRVLL